MRSRGSASVGEPRPLEDPSTGADFLTTLPFVDPERRGVFDICVGGVYVLSVARTEHRFKAVATVSAAPMGGSSMAFMGHEVPMTEHHPNPRGRFLLSGMDRMAVMCRIRLICRLPARNSRWR